MIDRSCDLCGDSGHTPIVTENGYPIVRCTSCGFVYVNRIPEVQDGKVVGEYYSGTPKEIEEGRVRYEAVSEYLLDEIERHSKKGSLLDVGCGYGFFLQAAGRRGWDAYGTDLSEIAVEHARSLTGTDNILCTDLRGDLFDGRTFDAVNLTNVLEHVPSPTQTLNACRGLLNPNGILTIRVPNMDFARLRHAALPLLKLAKLGKGGELSFLSSAPPVHLSGFSAATLRRYFEKCGLETVSIKPSKLSGLVNESPAYRAYESLVSTLYRTAAINLAPTLLATAKAQEKSDKEAFSMRMDLHT